MFLAFRSSIAVVSTGPKYTFVATLLARPPFNPIAEMKGLGKGVFGDPVKYQKKIREESLIKINEKYGDLFRN